MGIRKDLFEYKASLMADGLGYSRIISDMLNTQAAL